MITELIRVVQAGQELSNPAKWKKGQELTNLVGIVVSGLVELLRYFFPDVIISNGITEHITEGIGFFLITTNLYLTRATTKKDISKAFAEVPDVQ